MNEGCSTSSGITRSLRGTQEGAFAFVCWSFGIVARLKTVSAIRSADKCDICLFGKEICPWARIELINVQVTPVLCGL